MDTLPASTHKYSNLHYPCVVGNTCRPPRVMSVPEDSSKANGRPDGSVVQTPPFPFWPTQPRPSQIHHLPSPQQEPPPWGLPQTHWSPAVASDAVGLPPGLNAPWAPPPMAAPSGWDLEPGKKAVGGMTPNAEGWGENRKSGSKCLSQELDIKPGKNKYSIG